MRRRIALAVALVLAPAAGWANCHADATDISFGVYNPVWGAPANFSGSVTLSCDRGSGDGRYTIALTPGRAGNFAGRNMTRRRDSLPYQLYLDAAHTRVWGDGTGGSVLATGSDMVPRNGGTSEFTIYGQIAAYRVVPPGTYLDPAVHATVQY
jgi:spore coat protein U-like protein